MWPIAFGESVPLRVKETDDRNCRRTPKDIQEIVESSVSTRLLGRRFGVDPAAIRYHRRKFALLSILATNDMGLKGID
jgi:hypothetical protein